MRVLIQIKFLVFWENLMWWFNSHSNLGYKTITLLLDNCPIHKSASVKSYLTNSYWNTFLQTAYSPQLARVEKVFHIIKKKTLSLSKIFKKSIRIDQIVELWYFRWWGEWREQISKCFKKLYKRIWDNCYLVSIIHKLNEY